MIVGITVFRRLSQFRAAIVFLDTHHAAGAANQKASRGKGFYLCLVEEIVYVPHGLSE